MNALKCFSFLPNSNPYCFLLQIHGKKEFYDLETSVFRSDGFLRGNIVVEGTRLQVGSPTEKKPSSLEAAVKSSAKDSVIILSVVDSRYSEFATNLYETSLKKFGLLNYLMVCIDDDSFHILTKQGLNCVRYHQEQTNGYSNSSGDFGSLGYVDKTNLKTWIVLEVLRHNFTVFVMDLDVVLFKNPLPYFDCKDCDLHVTRDRVQVNSGFVYVRPTPRSKQLYQEAWNLYQKYHKASDQSYVNSALHILQNQKVSITLRELPRKLFQCGVYYFQEGGREFAGDKPSCGDCVMVHNNYIGSLAAKVYRFKENLLWTDDTGGYYSSQNPKYVTYENPYFFNDETWHFEVNALRRALHIAKVLKRILILPKFHCCQCERHRCENERHRCSLLSVVRLKAFDEEFSDIYREHSFLQNPLVPSKYRHVKSDNVMFLIKTAVYDQRDLNLTSLKIVNDTSSVDWREDIIRDFKAYTQEDVLRFHSMYGPPFSVGDSLKAAAEPGYFQCTNYEQWESKTHESVAEVLPSNLLPVHTQSLDELPV